MVETPIKIDCCPYKTKEYECRNRLKESTGWDRHLHLADYSNAMYEQRRYRSALIPIEQAHVIAPYCPYVLWNYAGTLRMLNRASEAKQIYRNLIKRGGKKIAEDKCAQGIEWARSLVNDCRYMLALIAKESDHYKEAIKWYRAYFKHKEKNVLSMFDKKQVVKEFNEMIYEYEYQ